MFSLPMDLPFLGRNILSFGHQGLKKNAAYQLPWLVVRMIKFCRITEKGMVKEMC